MGVSENPTVYVIPLRAVGRHCDTRGLATRVPDRAVGMMARASSSSSAPSPAAAAAAALPRPIWFLLWVALVIVSVQEVTAEVHPHFAHGVASGDPSHDGVVIWTRVTPTGRGPGEADPSADVEFPVTWVVSKTPPTSSPTTQQTPAHDVDVSAPVGILGASEGGTSEAPLAAAEEWEWEGAQVAATGLVRVVGTRDWTVKVDVTGLQHSVQYYYGFNTSGGRFSPHGTFRVPPPKGAPGMQTLRYAVFSCSNWGWVGRCRLTPGFRS